MNVVIAGGGSAALEALLALRWLAEERVQVTLISPDPDFVYRPMLIAEPFDLGRVYRFDLARIAAHQGATLNSDRVISVFEDRRVLRTGRGDDVGFDVLIVALGARSVEWLPGALTFGLGDPARMRRILAGLEAGTLDAAAFVVPERTGWALPIYELALMTANRLMARGRHDTELAVVTPEARPLELFGAMASEAVAGLLSERGVRLVPNARAVAARPDALEFDSGAKLPAAAAVTLPWLEGPRLEGLHARSVVPTDGPCTNCRMTKVRSSPTVVTQGANRDGSFGVGIEIVEGGRTEPLKVLVVGGGVAGCEALLALHGLGNGRLTAEILSPEDSFAYRPLAVAEPFGLGSAIRVPLTRIAADSGARLVTDALAHTDPERRVVRTRDGGELAYDALLVALGTRAVEALPGALSYRGVPDNPAFGRILEKAGLGGAQVIAFAVPDVVKWPLPLYELALLTAAHLDARGIEAVKLVFVTHEPAPLHLFGRRASDDVQDLLGAAGIELKSSSAPVAAEQGRLVLATDGTIAADHVVALPRLEVPPLPGLPQGPRGFISTDLEMKVDGISRAWAAGDATWFPVKQGGLAAQQADVAANAIARLAGAVLPAQRFHPVLRGALLTGGEPYFLRAEAGERPARSASGTRPLWWPPAKIAGRYLAPYLAHHGRDADGAPPLTDLDRVDGDDRAAAESDHHEALHSTLLKLDEETEAP
jgi:sulfide:quinone oxidoreductase